MTSSLFFLAAGIRPSSVTAEIVSCAVTSMDFFDRLQEQGEGLFFFQVIKKEFLLTKSRVDEKKDENMKYGILFI